MAVGIGRILAAMYVLAFANALSAMHSQTRDEDLNQECHSRSCIHWSLTGPRFRSIVAIVSTVDVVIVVGTDLVHTKCCCCATYCRFANHLCCYTNYCCMYANYCCVLPPCRRAAILTSWLMGLVAGYLILKEATLLLRRVCCRPTVHDCGSLHVYYMQKCWLTSRKYCCKD